MNSAVKTLVVAAMVLVYCSGCASYMVYKDSQKKVAYRHAVASKNEVAIKAIEMGNGGVGIGIDVTALDALKEQPLMQFFAAILDSGIIYAGYRGVEELNNNDDKHPNTTVIVSGDGNNTTVVNGDGDTTDTGADNNQELAE